MEQSPSDLPADAGHAVADRSNAVGSVPLAKSNTTWCRLWQDQRGGTAGAWKPRTMPRTQSARGCAPRLASLQPLRCGPPTAAAPLTHRPSIWGPLRSHARPPPGSRLLTPQPTTIDLRSSAGVRSWATVARGSHQKHSQTGGMMPTLLRSGARCGPQCSPRRAAPPRWRRSTATGSGSCGNTCR